ncbi:Asp-tRNA(Asn)/Glu-tRNA(Gln) amidotransferase subunit GatC [bacterium]|nr:Asp-tRNA(Asn)/Glu-tRNA(Gln) amidotransferase subunit GatC [bacterium]
MPTIDRETVLHVAELSRLELSPDALEAMTAHMKNMLELVAKLDAHDRKDISPRVHGGEGTGEAVLRRDEPRPSLAVEEALGNAPDKGTLGFRVPAILD